MSGFMIFTLVLAVLAIVFAFQAIKVVPQQSAWIVERLGKISRRFVSRAQCRDSFY